MPSRSQLQAELAFLRRNALYSCTAAEWLKAVEGLAARRTKGRKPTFEEFVQAAKDATVTCEACNGSGTYYWGACVNGKMTHSGPCFRCNGKGQQGQADFRRNWAYDQHRRVI